MAIGQKDVGAKTLSLWEKLTKSPSAEQDLREDIMPTEPGAEKTDRAAKKQKRAVTKAKRLEGKAAKQAKREAARREKSDSGKAVRLCSLATVEVKKTKDGFHVSVDGGQGNRSFSIAPGQADQVLRDLETAIVVIRGQA